MRVPAANRSARRHRGRSVDRRQHRCQVSRAVGTIFQTLVAALGLAMVFVIQHTQARHQRATQRKLDEILLAMPGTDNSLLRLEHASDDELRAAGDQQREIRQATWDRHSGPGAA